MNDYYDVLMKKLTTNLIDYSPVVITGNTGSGKTTFLEVFYGKLRSIACHDSCDENKGMCDGTSDKCAKLINADKLFKTIIEAISNRKSDSWKEDFEPYGYIIIDDFDRLIGKSTTQDILFTYFRECNKPVIVAAKTPIEGSGYNEEIIDYFSNGTHIHIDDPKRAEKLNKLNKILESSDISIESEALSWIREREFISYSSVEGYVKTLHLFSADTPLTLEECREHAKVYIREEYNTSSLK